MGDGGVVVSVVVDVVAFLVTPPAVFIVGVRVVGAVIVTIGGEPRGAGGATRRRSDSWVFALEARDSRLELQQATAGAEEGTEDRKSIVSELAGAWCCMYAVD